SPAWDRWRTYRIALGFRNAKRYADALACLEQAIAQEPNDADLWFERGLCNQNIDRKAEAATYFERAIEIDPQHAWSHNFLARHWRDEGDFTKGLVCVAKACKHAPEEPSAWHVKAQLEVRAKKTATAIAKSARRARELYVQAFDKDSDAEWTFQIACIDLI